MRFNIFTHGLLVFICLFSIVNCWESYELDLFDLVEEVGQNFYEFFGVSQNSDGAEIKKAYRKLSLQLHPDRNNEPDAEKKFRYLVSIYDVLKDEVKRARYDKVLEFGLPDWKTPIYYFRRVKKMTMYELTITLSIIITIGHYFVMWAQHFEKKLTLDDRISDVRKLIEKKQKKKKTDAQLDELDAQLQNMYDTLPAPKLKETLPVKLTVFLFNQTCQIPNLVKDKILSRNQSKSSDNEFESDEEQEKENFQKKPKSKKQQTQVDLNPKEIKKTDLKPVVAYNLNKTESDTDNNKQASLDSKNKEWSDKEKSDFIKAIAKYPAGSINRWNNIAEMVGRTAPECIQMEKLMKSNLNSLTFSNLNASVLNNPKKSVEIKEEPTLAQDFSTESNNTSTDQWSQEQQKCLEKALKEISKDTSNRWERIAENVPGKTKDDCINRYKDLCASLKKK